jgi:hypothetical protein
MVRKLIVGLFISMLAVGSVNAEEIDITYTSKYAIGYKDAVNRLSFSPSLTDMVNKIGKVDAFEIAINRDKNPVAFMLNNSLNYKETKFDLTAIADNQFFERNSVAMYSNNGIIYVKTFTDTPFSTRTIETENYRVTYTVGNGYLYKVVIETKYQEAKYKENFDRQQQKEYLTARTHNYLNNNGYKTMSSWYNKNNKFIKDDLIVEVDTSEEVDKSPSKPSNYFSVSVTNERLMQEYKKGKRTAYNTEVNKAFNDFDRVMK